MSTNAASQVTNQIPSICPMDFGSQWREHIDNAGRNGLALYSDIGDKLISIWLSRRGTWHLDTTQHPSKKDAKNAALSSLHEEISQRAERLAFFQVTSADARCLLRSIGVFTLRSIDRTMIEFALINILTTSIETSVFANVLPIENSKTQTQPTRIMAVRIPHTVKDACCRLRAEPIRVDIEVYHPRSKQTRQETHYLRNITDGAINEFIARILYRNLQEKLDGTGAQ